MKILQGELDLKRVWQSFKQKFEQQIGEISYKKKTALMELWCYGKSLKSVPKTENSKKKLEKLRKI